MKHELNDEPPYAVALQASEGKPTVVLPISCTLSLLFSHLVHEEAVYRHA